MVRKMFGAKLACIGLVNLREREGERESEVCVARADIPWSLSV